jgi:hypothetical protein
MATPHPFPWRLSIPGIGVVLAILPFFFEQWGNQQPWWNTMPWLVILFTALGIFAGALYGEITDRRSDLREWFRSRRRIFDVQFHPASEIKGGADLNVPYFALKCERRMRDM